MLLIPSAKVHAQAAGTDAAAEALFRDGRQLMEQGQYAEACQRFEASYRIDVAVGTLLNLADCLERDGRLASAWAKFLEAASHAARSGGAAREQVARERAALLEPRLVRARFVVRSPVEGLEIRVSGQLMPEATWSVAIPIDPGVWGVEATAPGYIAWRHEYQAQSEGSTLEIVVPQLAVDEAARAAALAAEQAAARAAEAARVASQPPPPPARGHGLRTVAWVTGGLGLATMGIAAGYTASAHSVWSDANCPGNVCATTTDQRRAESAHERANIATGLVVGGGALLATSLVLFIVSPSRTHDDTGAHFVIAPTVDTTGAGLAARGSF